MGNFDVPGEFSLPRVDFSGCEVGVLVLISACVAFEFSCFGCFRSLDFDAFNVVCFGGLGMLFGVGIRRDLN